MLLSAKGNGCLCTPKGNGINAWIGLVELLDMACAGYIDEDMQYCFMP